MTAGPSSRRNERLVPVKAAARVLGWSADAIREWVNGGDVPAVRTPGGQLSLYDSWLEDVLDSAQPGVTGDMAAVTERWYAARAVPLKEVAA
jgi:hypothetical protein